MELTLKIVAKVLVAYLKSHSEPTCASLEGVRYWSGGLLSSKAVHRLIKLFNLQTNDWKVAYKDDYLYFTPSSTYFQSLVIDASSDHFKKLTGDIQ